MTGNDDVADDRDTGRDKTRHLGTRRQPLSTVLLLQRVVKFY